MTHAIEDGTEIGFIADPAAFAPAVVKLPNWILKTEANRAYQLLWYAISGMPFTTKADKDAQNRKIDSRLPDARLLMPVVPVSGELRAGFTWDW